VSARRRLALAPTPAQAAYERDLLDLPLREVFARLDAVLRRVETAGGPSALPVAEKPVWLDARAAGAYLGLHERSIRKSAEAGALQGVRLGGRSTWRFRREWLDAFVEGGAPDQQRPRQAAPSPTRPDSAGARPVCDAGCDGH
jgi:excisionase family DNA binding protein